MVFVFRVSPGIREIEEAVAAYLVISDFSVRCTDFQEGEDVVFREEFLVRKNPSCRVCREEAEAFSFREVLGAVVSGIELDEISVVVRVGDTSGEADHSLGNVECETRASVLLGIVKCQGAYIVFVECPVVFELGFEVQLVVLVVVLVEVVADGSRRDGAAEEQDFVRILGIASRAVDRCSPVFGPAFPLIVAV